MDITSSIPPYRFPLLKSHEIVDSLADGGIEISSNELMEPNRHKDKVKSIYHDLVIMGLNLEKDTFNTTSMSLMQKRQNLPHPELHDESFTNLKFIKAIMKLMRISGINDFGIHDLYSPSTKRFKRQLSGIINYIKFANEKEATLINEINESKDELIGGLLEVRQEQEMLNDQLLQVQLDSEKRWGEAKVTDDDCGDIEIEIARQNKLQASIRHESQEMKKVANVLKDKIATTELAIQELGVKERKLVPQVVESPIKLKEDIGDLTAKLEQERKHCEEAEHDAKLALLRVGSVIEAQDAVVEANNILKQAADNKENYEQSLEESKSMEEKIRVHETESTRLKNMNKDLEKELHKIEDKTYNFQQQAMTKMDAAKASLHALNAELLLVEKDRRDATSKVEKCDEEVQLLKRFIDEEKIKTDEEIKEIIVAFQKMECVILDEITEFDDSIDKATKASKTKNLSSDTPTLSSSLGTAVESN
jgi:kinetochore protein Nuf2